MQKYGRDAVKFVNSKEGKQLYLRGLYARVIQAGAVHVGDEVRKICLPIRYGRS
jgi:MOSC domain-containing protein YiiM